MFLIQTVTRANDRTTTFHSLQIAANQQKEIEVKL
jgi:hypothetical protein